MADKPVQPPREPGETRKGWRIAAHLQEIEGNPLTADEIAMFEMFEREGWSPERRRAYILASVSDLAAE